MKKNLSVSIGRFDNDNHDTTLSISEWNSLFWLVAGDELIFVQSGSEFEMKKLTGAGWVLKFNQLFAMDYLERYPDTYNHALVANIDSKQVNFPMSAALRSEMNDLAILLSHAQHKGQSELYMQAYADLIFLNANQLYAKQNGRI